mgnify:CR=1 FL=1
MPLLTIVIGLGGADGELRLELEKVLLSQASDIHQLSTFLKGPFFCRVLDDAGGGFRADAGQRFEVGRGRGVDVDRAWLGAGFAAVDAPDLLLRRRGDGRQRGEQTRRRRRSSERSEASNPP